MTPRPLTIEEVLKIESHIEKVYNNYQLHKAGKLLSDKKPEPGKRNRVSGKHSLRDWAFFRFQLDSYLRSCDLVLVTLSDILFDGALKSRFDLHQKKTGVPLTICLSDKTIAVLNRFINETDLKLDFLFYSNKSIHSHLDENNWNDIFKSYAEATNIDTKYLSSKSIRKTKPSVIYQDTKDIFIVQKLLGQKSTRDTRRFLGIDKNYALDVAKKYDF
ncbi:MAG: tyrosine-type recombinase/integrase [Deltaproteobacteria bacterium]|jgi:integrase|nr:tyrosine-type recombinase/integrase [Deltaproteobacteria bacterium]MBT4526682.1 tyrosine-type recombinase/integrase [Deltaproteobacteria bacterium]